MSNFLITNDVGILLRPRSYKAKIIGTIKDGHGKPLERYVKIYRKELRGTVYNSGWSNSSGAFSFDINDNQNREFTIIVHGEENENYVIWERVKVSE